MNRLKIFAFTLVLTSSTLASANTLNERDATTVAALATQARQIREDISQYNAGRLAAGNSNGVQAVCWEQLFSVTEAATIAISHAAMSIKLSSQMINPQDEALALMAAKADIEGSIAMSATVRKVTNYVLGACSSEPLLISTSQRLSSFLSRADTTFSSLSRRLP